MTEKKRAGVRRNDRIRIYGARMTRFAHRFFCYIGLVALFSIVTGAPSEDGEGFTGVLLVLALSVGSAILWLTNKKQRELDRSQQIAAETILLFPDADAAELDHEYTLRRRREKRTEALFYLNLAVLTGIWFWAMYAIGAGEASWLIGGRVILPGLLLISAVLFILSVLPIRKDQKMPGVSRQDLELTESILKRGDTQPADEKVGTLYSLSLEEKCKTPEEYLRKERTQQRRDTAFTDFRQVVFRYSSADSLWIWLHSVDV